MMTMMMIYDVSVRSEVSKGDRHRDSYDARKRKQDLWIDLSESKWIQNDNT